MTEEYMTSAEIREKIAELKIRLAFQLEFEEELKKTLAECEKADSEPEEQRTDRSAEILGRIEAEARKRRYSQRRRGGRVRAGKVVLIAAVLMLVSIGSALAAICMVEAGILNIKVCKDNTVFRLLETKSKVDVPEGWQGKYYPRYIPEGYSVKTVNGFGVRYIDEAGNEIGYSEKNYGRRKGIDTEDAMVSSETLNGIEVMVMEKNGRTSILWNADNRYFVVEVHEGKGLALKIAASVSLIE